MPGAREALARLHRHARRVGEVARVLAKFGLADGLRWLDLDWVQDHLRAVGGERLREQSFEARVRLALTELGTTFIKLGQTLSTRPDLVGNELAAELAGLQANTRADPPEVARATIAAELGRDPTVAFASFDPAAFASASIAQVHRAVLPGGERVVLKVMRQGVRDQAATDLEILQSLARLAEKHAPALRPCQPAALVRQLQRTLRRELDFTCERRNLEHFARAFAGDAGVRFPQVHPEWCTASVLTMEYLDGVSAADAPGLRAAGVDLGAFARSGARIYLEMIFRDGFYHADPHPGNLLLLPGGTVGVLDCGMVGRLDDGLRDDVLAMLAAAVAGNADELCDHVLRIGAAPPGTDARELRTELAEFLRDYVDVPLAELDVGNALATLIDLVRRYQVSLPAPLSLLLRTVIVLEGTSRGLDRAFGLAELVRPVYARAARRQLSPRRLAMRLLRSSRQWQRLAAALPGDLSHILGTLRRGALRLQFEHRHLDARVDRLIQGMIVAALILGSSWLWISPAPPRLFGAPLLGLLGYALAVFLGLRLWRHARRAGTEND